MTQHTFETRRKLAGLVIAPALGVASLTVALLAPAFVTAGHATDVATRLTAASIEPIVLLRARAIAACGLKMVGIGDGRSVTITLTLAADAGRTTGTRLRLAGRVDATRFASGADTPSPRPKAITALRYRTASITVSSQGSALTETSDGALETSPDLDALAGGEIFRETLLSGAVAVIDLEGAPAVELSIAGPVEHSVRAAYLNCAGDLVRPEAGGGLPP